MLFHLPTYLKKVNKQVSQFLQFETVSTESCDYMNNYPSYPNIYSRSCPKFWFKLTAAQPNAAKKLERRDREIWGDLPVGRVPGYLVKAVTEDFPQL